MNDLSSDIGLLRREVRDVRAIQHRRQNPQPVRRAASGLVARFATVELPARAQKRPAAAVAKQHFADDLILKVASENPNARADRQIVSVKEEAQRTLSVFAASLLGIMAGSSSEATYLIQRLAQLIDALNELNALSSWGLTIAEVEEALRLPGAEQDLAGSDDWAYRRWLESTVWM